MAAEKTWPRTIISCLVALTIGMAAQAPPPSPGSKTGNPTPGTPQPDPPNLANRITLTGCVQRTAENGAEKAGGSTDPNTPSDARFVLTKAERKNTVPAGTGASPVAAASRSRCFQAQPSPGGRGERWVRELDRRKRAAVTRVTAYGGPIIPGVQGRLVPVTGVDSTSA